MSEAFRGLIPRGPLSVGRRYQTRTTPRSPGRNEMTPSASRCNPAQGNPSRFTSA